MNSDKAPTDQTHTIAKSINSKQQDQPTEGPVQSRYKPLIILLFAAILLCVSGIAKSQEPQPRWIDNEVGQSVMVDQATISDVTPIPNAVPVPSIAPIPSIEPIPSVAPIQNVGPTSFISGSPKMKIVTQASFEAALAKRQSLIQYSQSRPKYAEISATLANFDADADPDGWRVQLVLRDSQDRPVVMRSRANFELTPRIPTADFHSHVDAAPPISWSMNVDFDADGVARFKLPLRENLRPAFGWNSSTYAGPTKSRRSSRGLHRRVNNGHRSSGATVFGDLAVTSLRASLGRPTTGELRVRVSVPTEGVFKAATAVPIRPPSLVDSTWPYR